jgi:ATP-dependent Clp protease protease subunit
MSINFNEHAHAMPPKFPGYAETYIKLSKDRIIFLNENVTKQSASDLAALLLYYDNVSDEEISIYLHCNGGDAAGLTNIYDVMQMIKSPVRTVCLGKCYSAAAVILAAGTPGERCAFKHSKIMIHGIQAGFPIPGHDMTNSKNYYQFLKDNNDNIMKMLAKHTGHPLEKIKQDCTRDVWLDVKQALEYGIIDEVL